MGINFAAIGFNIMHDACHGSFSKKDWVNYLFGLSLNAMGGNAFLWKEKHNTLHHSYTNIDGVDEDVTAIGMRFHFSQKWKWYYRGQFIYGPLLYGLTYAAWIFFGDFKKYFLRRIGAQEMHSKITWQEHVIFWLSKALYGGIFVALPWYIVGTERFLWGFGVMLYVTGLFLSIVFQLAHVVEGVENPAPPISDEWAIHEVKTTANFATRNKVISWLCGGLNFQIEHHLFPKISHVHYPKLQKLVQETCREFNLKYNEKRTFLLAIWSHLVRLYKLSLKPAL